MIKAVLFDCDGVLINSEELYFETLNKVLNNHYNELVSPEILQQRFTGKTLKQIEYELTKEHSKFNNFEKKSIPYCEAMTYEHKHLNNNTLEILNKINENKKIAVCSNSTPKSLNKKLENTKIINFFDLILNKDSVKKEKPHPDIYLKAIKEFNLKPEECLIVEDSETGIAAAKKSGAKVALLKNKFNTKLHNDPEINFILDNMIDIYTLTN